MMSYPIKCEGCGGDKFRVSLAKHTKKYFLECANDDCEHEDLYYIGGMGKTPTLDDNELHKKMIEDAAK